MGEEKKDASQLREIHHLLTQRKSAEAQQLLAQLTGMSPEGNDELNYLRTWYAVTQEDWDDVTQKVRDFPALPVIEGQEHLLATGSVRRRRPACLLVLSAMAHRLGYPEEAIEHIQYGLAFLNERRMNIPEVRLLSHINLGYLSLETNQTSQALFHYENARNLYDDEEENPPLLATILTGLCETQTRLEHFEQALATGKEALRLLQSQPGICQQQLLMRLARINLSLNEHASALAYAQDARLMAEQVGDSPQIAQTLLLLAEVQWKGSQVSAARASCQQALALLPVTQDQSLRGKALLLAGQIAEAEWRCQQKQGPSASEALTWYEQARAFFAAQQDILSLADVLKQIAQLLEDTEQPGQALVYWKDAYQLSGQYR